ncbi:MAG: carboxypeptidase-like regulatory domain-containing protein, partial [Candidatus Promineifilaceae bacterium]
MLDSHNRWQTLQAEVRGQWSATSSQVLQHTILIRQPYLAQISGADYQATLGTDESAQQRIMHDLSLLPISLEEIQPITVYPHPMVGMGFGFAGDYIFPAGFAQRVGRFELIAEEPILERQAWVVDWFDVMNGGERRNRFWIDQQTGLILKSWEYGEGAITGEVEFLSLVLDEPISDEAFQVAEETASAGRTVNGRIITSDEQPVPAVQLRLAPGEPPVTETVGDGRFTLRDLPFTAVTIFADYFQFTIPAGEEPLLDLGDVEYPLIDTPFTLENYPPSETPYRFGSFWLVHTPDGQLIAFSPVSPEYDDRVSVEECQFAWDEANQRFTDPCSGDEWELNGRLNLEQSTELWSNRNLDQFFVHVTDGQIFVQIDRLYQSLPANEPPLASGSQFGVTMTVKTAEFAPSATSLTTLTQVDPIWGMNPLAFPPQQALTYANSMVDAQGRFYEPIAGQGGLPVTDATTNGLQQEYITQWQPTADDAQTITATLTTELNNLYRQITFQPAWGNHQEGDVWEVDMPLEIGYAIARVTRLEWLGTADDGRIRLRLTVVDDSPDGLALQCLYLSNTPPATPACANFSDQ